MANTKVYLSGGRIQGRSDDVGTGGYSIGQGSASDGVATGSPATGSRTAIYGAESLNFDGSAEWVSLSQNLSNSLDVTSVQSGMSSAWTVSLWVYVDNSSTGQHTYLSKTTNPYSGNYHELNLRQSDGVFQFGTGVLGYTNTSISHTGWNHLVLSITGIGTSSQTWSLYIDNGSALTDSTSSTMDWNTTSPIYCGNQGNLSTERQMDGEIQELCFWNKELSSANRTALFGGGDPYAHGSATASDNTGAKANTVEQANIVAYYPFDGAVFTNSAIKTDASKDSITNVPDGTRYEETDTRKIFHKRTSTGSGGGDLWVEKGNTFSASALRGFASGGSTSSGASNIIDYVAIQTLGNAADFGDLTNSREGGGACADATRCLEGASASIDYWTAATLGNAVDFGDLSTSRNPQDGALADATRGVFAGGSNVIDYVTIQSAGNATDFGDLQGGYGQTSGCADATRGLISGGWTGAYVDSIDYITIQSAGNAQDFGNMTAGKYALAALADATRGCIGGGHTGSVVNNIDYVTIQTTGNAADFGDMDITRHKHTAYADATRGCWVGGGDGRTNTIGYFTIQTLGNAVDFGDLTRSCEVTAGCAA